MSFAPAASPISDSAAICRCNVNKKSIERTIYYVFFTFLTYLPPYLPTVTDIWSANG